MVFVEKKDSGGISSSIPLVVGLLASEFWNLYIYLKAKSQIAVKRSNRIYN
jgi:hypothetical protein